MSKRPNRIAEWRDNRGLTQEELAAKLGTTHATISRLERGKMDFSEKWMRRIGKELRVPITELVIAEEEEALDTAADLAREILASLPPEQRRHWLEMGEALAFRLKAS